MTTLGKNVDLLDVSQLTTDSLVGGEIKENGELAKVSMTDEFKENVRTIPWKQLYGMRNRIVHGYSGVNMNRCILINSSI